MCEICDGQSGIVTGFSTSTSVLRRQCYSINARNPYPSTHSSYQKDKRAKHGNLPKNMLFRKSGRQEKKVLAPRIGVTKSRRTTWTGM
jgi:hypothetical protein